jgi:integrase
VGAIQSVVDLMGTSAMYPNPRVPVVSGHAFLREGARGSVWYAKWRDSGGQHQRMLGQVWPGKGPPPEGFFRGPRKGGYPPSDVEAVLAALLTDARRGTLETVRNGLTFAELADDWLRHGERQRGWKTATLKDYRSAVTAHLKPAFGKKRAEDIDSCAIEAWRTRWLNKHGKPRQASKLVAILHGIYERGRRVHGLRVNPAADVERLIIAYDSRAYDFYSPDEVWALSRAAASEQDAVLYLLAAFAGLRRGECVALRWRDVDFDRRVIRVLRSCNNYGEVGTPKSGKGRAVPLVTELAEALDRLRAGAQLLRPDGLVFPSSTGEPLNGSALRRRFKIALQKADLRPLRFHDLRHTFGSLAIDRASIVQVAAWMGHADVSTTMRYLHHKSHADEADLLGGAFAAQTPPAYPDAAVP